jgi:hypothetical protein
MDSITNHITGSIPNTNKENQQARQIRVDKNLKYISARMQHTGQVLTSAGSEEYENEVGTKISVAVVTQENTSDDNANGKKQESGEVCLEETGNHTAWDNQLKGCVTKRRNEDMENGTGSRPQNS